MRYQDLQKTLVKESAIFAAGLVACVGLAYLLTTVSDDYGRDVSTSQNEVSTMTSNMNALMDKYLTVQKNAPLYKEALQKSASDQLLISRQLLHTKFDSFKNKYFMSNIRMTMSSIQEVPGHKYKDIPNVIVSSDVALAFNALTDEDIYGLLQSIRDELTGVVKVNHFTLKRENKVTDAGLRAIIESGQFTQVSGEIKFTWYGLKPLDISAAQVNDKVGAIAPEPQP